MSSSRRQYPFHLIEPKWQRIWDEQQAFRAWNPGDTIPAEHPFAKRHQLESKTADAAGLPPKFYILDMFPYPSGAGLHVGHPEGYTATDILARYRRAQGYNVLHPMGWDAFGLPAEQYAIRTGQHPRVTTEANITTFKRQIKSLGFSYDWNREIDTTNPKYFKWTQWIFLKLYNSWFNPETNKAEPIETLQYPKGLECDGGVSPAEKDFRQDAGSTIDLEAKRRAYRDSKRLAYVTEAPVWWCEELGTVLANEEVIEGKSEVGSFAVVRKPMRQWMLRITAYAERLLNDLATIDWSHSLKEMQRNWIGRSEGAEVDFEIADCGLGIADCERRIRVFTTRPDTLFGATYIVLSPEHKLVDVIVTSEHKKAVEEYKTFAASRSDLERTELAKEKTGVFTGAYATNPAIGEKIPIWIADYVLASYGTGAIMAVPGHDTRDFEFAKRFMLPIFPVVGVTTPKVFDFDPAIGYSSYGVQSRLISVAGKETPVHSYADHCIVEEGISLNSANSEISLDGLPTLEAKNKITAWLEAKGQGRKTINYKLRDWLFSRQRYWGEPFPIVWKRDASGNLFHEALPESALPVLPPPLDDYKPTPDGQPPLARAKDWVSLPDGSVRETNTMPQWAGSCWYYLRYLDAKNDSTFVGKEAERYWMGARASSKFKVQSSKSSVAPSYSEPGTLDFERKFSHPPPHVGGYGSQGVDLYVGGTEHAVLHLLYSRFWHKVLFDLGSVSTPEPFFKLVNQGLILGEDGQKMSKSRGNVINPDDILAVYGADAFRLYEMFMGPLEMVKPWSTNGVEGVYRFLGRVWRLFVDEKSETEFEQAIATTETQRHCGLLDAIKLSTSIQEAPPTPGQLKTLHACIKKVTEDLDGLRFNTAISALMVFINEAISWPTKPLAVLKDFLILLQPFAPHLAEELWAKLDLAFRTPHSALTYAPWPKFDPALLVESTIEIPVQVNGKLRDKLVVPAEATEEQIKGAALASAKVKEFTAGKVIKKIIVVPKKLVNVVAA